jgi:hypothetical protein
MQSLHGVRSSSVLPLHVLKLSLGVVFVSRRDSFKPMRHHTWPAQHLLSVVSLRARVELVHRVVLFLVQPMVQPTHSRITTRACQPVLLAAKPTCAVTQCFSFPA